MKKIIVFVSLFFILSVSANAAGFGGMGIYPANPDPAIPASSSWFVYNLLPGETKHDVLRIQNTTDKTLSAKIYPVDGTTTSEGAFALLNQNDPREGVGKWVEFSATEATLNPGEARDINFNFSVPPGTAAGSYIGGIVLENKQVSEGQGVNVVSRVGVRIYQTVPGNLKRALSLKDLSWKLVNDKPNLYFDLINEGNVRLDVSGKIQFINGFTGKQVSEEDADLRMVLPDKPTKVPYVWKNAPLLGSYIARVKVDYGSETEVIEREVRFMYVTRKAMVMAGLGILGLLILRVVAGFNNRKRR